MSIRLSPKLGLNPGMTCCPRCGGRSNELVLAGDAWMYQCKCGQKVVSHGYPIDPCGKCGLPGKKDDRYRNNFTRLRPFDGSKDKTMAREPCDSCKKQIKEHQEEVAKGGVYWKCVSCGSEGVIKASPFTAHVREAAGVATPNPVGVEFDQEHGCPVCGQEAGNA